MLTIRPAQIQTFSKLAQERFEARITAHLKKIWPHECEELGREGLQKTIEHGIKRANGHGFKTEFDVARFIDLMFTLSLNFDQDHRLAWAMEILANDHWKPTERMDRLYERTERELTLRVQRQQGM